MTEQNTILKKYLWVLVAGGLILLGVLNFKALSHFLFWLLGVIFPFLLGPCIAFVLNVPMKTLERRFRLKRGLSLLVTLVFICGIILLVMFLVIPELARTVVTLKDTIPSFLRKLEGWAKSFFAGNPEAAAALSNLDIDVDKIEGILLNYLRNGLGSFVGSTVSAALSVVNSVATFFIAFTFATYILTQKEKLSVQFTKLLYAYFPDKKADRIRGIAGLAAGKFSRFISGQCIEVCILGTLFFISMSIFRFPYAVMISILVAITSFIPVFGAFIACFIGALLILMVNPVQALLFVLLFLVIQQIEGNVIYPRVIGNSLGLPSIWVFTAVILGGNIMGVAGMIIFIPLCSVAYVLLRDSAQARLELKESPWATVPSEEPKVKKHRMKNLMQRFRKE